MRLITNVAAFGILFGGGTAMAVTTTYAVSNLTSDQAGQAANTDPHLVNAWGLAFNPKGAAWVNDNGTGLSTLYDGNGLPLSLVVTVPPPGGSAAGATAAPTGLVFNSTASNFTVGQGPKTGKSAFIFSTEDGTISGWSPGVNLTNAILKVDQSAQGAVFKGLAIGNVAGGPQAGDYLYATDFRHGLVSTFDSSFHPVNLAGGFVDPGISPASGLAPFGVRDIGGQIYVTYAVQNALKHDDVAGAGNGVVDVFTADGTFEKRLVTGGQLNSPWGLAQAPADFGDFGGDLLVGNFGDGTVNAYDPLTGAFRGTLESAPGKPLVEDGLWALEFGNGLPNAGKNELFFTAGPAGETHGLFGKIDAVPEPGTVAAIGAGLLLLAGRRKIAR